MKSSVTDSDASIKGKRGKHWGLEVSFNQLTAAPMTAKLVMLIAVHIYIYFQVRKSKPEFVDFNPHYTTRHIFFEKGKLIFSVNFQMAGSGHPTNLWLWRSEITNFKYAVEGLGRVEGVCVWGGGGQSLLMDIIYCVHVEDCRAFRGGADWNSVVIILETPGHGLNTNPEGWAG